MSRTSIILGLAFFSMGGFAQSHLEQLTPNPAAAKLFFYDRTYHQETERNWKIATLPASSAGTGDKIMIEFFGGAYLSGYTFQQVIHMANRNGFQGYLRSTLGNQYEMVRIRAYEQLDGSVDVFLSLLPHSYKGGSVRIYEGSAITAVRPTIYQAPSDVGPSPTGTLVFDSHTETPGLIVRNDSNVGIGTTTPNEKLEVNGTIRSKEVKVEASPWPDYVFEPDYNLRSLEETEAFIQEHGHLPEVPSSGEVEEEGIALGEMNALLLKKIEELTLYLIAEQKENKRQKRQIEELIKNQKLNNK